MLAISSLATTVLVVLLVLLIVCAVAQRRDLLVGVCIAGVLALIVIALGVI